MGRLTRASSTGPGAQKPKGGPATAVLLAVVNGALVGVGSVYVTTRSVPVTLIAAAAAVILAGLALLTR
jgi:hypothetical protein